MLLNLALGWIGLTVTKIYAYHDTKLITVVKSFTEQAHQHWMQKARAFVHDKFFRVV